MLEPGRVPDAVGSNVGGIHAADVVAVSASGDGMHEWGYVDAWSGPDGAQPRRQSRGRRCGAQAQRRPLLHSPRGDDACPYTAARRARLAGAVGLDRGREGRRARSWVGASLL